MAASVEELGPQHGGEQDHAEDERDPVPGGHGLPPPVEHALVEQPEHGQEEREGAQSQREEEDVLHDRVHR